MGYVVAVNIETTSSGMSHCNLVAKLLQVGGTCCRWKFMFLENGLWLSDYMVTHSRRL